MSTETPREKADRFINEAKQFRLGALLTETPHPRSRTLSQTARESIPAALGILFDVDSDVIAKYCEWSAGAQPKRMAEAVARAVLGGGKVFCTGCGATGRLSIQMTSIWRDFWQKQRAAGLKCQPSCEELENRSFSVMAGGDYALIKSVEGFEDFTQFGRKQIRDLGVSKGDVVFAITEGGETSFVIGTAWEGLDSGAEVFYVYNNPDSVLREHVVRSREVIDEPRIEKVNITSGPMAITGSTRMQATSMELAVMVTVWEMALRMILAKVAPGADLPGVAEGPDGVPADFQRVFQAVHAALTSADLRRPLAGFVEMEAAVYKSGHKNSYFADRLAVDVLTDTTERSPTFCIPAFRKWDDLQAAESWSFLFLPAQTAEDAWRHLLKREPAAVEWSLEDVKALIGPETAERQHEVMREIGLKEILRFRIGLDGLQYRPFNPGDSASAIVTGAEMAELTSPDGFYRTQLEAAHARGAQVGLVFLGTAEEIGRAKEFVSGWDAAPRAVYLEAPACAGLLDAGVRLGVKMLLNALSTCTMVRLGRVLGNVMIWVVPSNLKLIDRSTRYIQQLAGVSYEDACRMLFDVVEYVTPRMKAGQAYPSPVGVSVMRLKHGLSNEDAEAQLYKELE